MSVKNLTKAKQICFNAKFVKNGIILDALNSWELSKMPRTCNLAVWNVWNSNRSKQKAKDYKSMHFYSVNNRLFTIIDRLLQNLCQNKKYSKRTITKSLKKSKNQKRAWIKQVLQGTTRILSLKSSMWK